MKPTDNPLWPVFVQHAEENGIGLEHEDDWLQWWLCFLAGVMAYTMVGERMTKKQAVELVFNWQYCSGTSLSSELFPLFAKADKENRARFHVAFPELFQAWQEWFSADDPDKWFLSHGVGVGRLD